MKKILLFISVLILLCVLLVSCNKLIDDENSKGAVQNEASLTDLSVPLDVSSYNVSVDDENSEEEISIPRESSTTPEDKDPEDSIPDASEPESYTVEDLHSLFIELKKEEEQGDRELSLDNIHIGAYFTVDGYLIDYIGTENFDKAVEMFGITGINHGIVCDYFGITKQEYMALYQEVLDSIMPEYPAALYMGIFCYQYDVWFSDEYWSHPELFYSDYVPSSEVKSYYTSIYMGRQHIRAYYNIDYKLIEYVGEDEFENWLDEKEKKEQNILEFIKDFGITEGTFASIYKDIKTLPYNPDYLFGTPEMQDEYFRVHPLN